MYGQDNTRLNVLLPRRIPDPVLLVEPGSNGSPGRLEPNICGLVERIQALPGVYSEAMTISHSDTATACYIDGEYVVRTLREDPYLLCKIDGHGIEQVKLAQSDADEVIRKGWGMPFGESLCIYPPRDVIEMEIAWRVILLAYQFPTLRSPKSVHRVFPQVATATRSWL